MPVDVVAPKISIIPIMVPSSPNKGAIVAIVPKVVRYLESSTSIEFSSSKIRSFTVTSLLLKFAFSITELSLFAYVFLVLAI